jgi:glycosyltransferase involved in cell wall biosynthesis
MKILLLAPQPFYQERGTPIAVDLVLRGLSERGDFVDAYVYPEGLDRSYPGLQLHRIRRLPFTTGIAPGPSLRKVWCDIVLFVAAVRAAGRGRYDLVHAVEESVFTAMLIRRVHGVSYLYDMDSCLSEQLLGKYSWLRPLKTLLERCEAAAIRGAVAVAPVCDELAAYARQCRSTAVEVLYDISLLPPAAARPPSGQDLRTELGLEGEVAAYIGNLEAYQGIDLLLESFALARPRLPTARLLVIGGEPALIKRHCAQAKRLGVDDAALFLGPRPVADLSRYVEAADVLVSPRVAGRNTPMKIYSYLHAGKAILATDLPTHTQILNADVACLAPPTPGAFADALVRLMTDAPLRRRLGAAGRSLAEARHTYPAFRKALDSIYDGVRTGQASVAGGKSA